LGLLGKNFSLKIHRYEEMSIVNSIHLKIEKDSLNEVQIEYLALKTQEFLSFDSILTCSDYQNKMFPIIIVDNYKSKNIDLVTLFLISA